MARHTLLQTMLAAAVVLSLTAVLQADTKVIISGSHHGVGIGIGTTIGRPSAPPMCYPPVHRHVVLGSPWRHRFIHRGPPVVVHYPPVAPVIYPPVVRHVVLEPAPPVIVRTPLPVEESSISIWITNSNGSKTSVRLTREGPWYVGPRGEYYAEMPTNEQLRVVYGF